MAEKAELIAAMAAEAKAVLEGKTPVRPDRELQIVIAGFGGQGSLFAGKVTAEAGLLEDRELSWFPSYGPEMRGGAANVSVCISDDPIGSPLIANPCALIAMNQPSVDKFIGNVAPGGVAVVDSALAPNIPVREDITTFVLTAQALAEENGLKGLGNIVLLGKLWAETRFCEVETLFAAIAECVPPRKAHLLEPNMKALLLGMQQ